MSDYVIINGELYHHGVKGMKWGVRRYQNPDGSLTAAGRKRYAKDEYKRATDSAFKRYEKSINSIEKGYRRGQNLSDKDVARENAAEKRYQKETAKAKAAYKDAKRQIKVDAKEAAAAKKEEKQLQTKQKKWESDVDKHWVDAYNSAADKINKKIEAFNKEWEGVDLRENNAQSKAYVKAYCDMWNDIYVKELDSKFGKSPVNTGREWCERVPMFMDPEDELY